MDTYGPESEDDWEAIDDEFPNFPGETPYNRNAVMTEVSPHILWSIATTLQPNRLRSIADVSPSGRAVAIVLAARQASAATSPAGAALPVAIALPRRGWTICLAEQPMENDTNYTRASLFNCLKRELLEELTEYDLDIKDWQEKWDELETMSSDPAADHTLLGTRRVELQRMLLGQGADLGPGDLSNQSSKGPGYRITVRGTVQCVENVTTGANGTAGLVTSAPMV
ncbi:hypothetical protein O1611_g1413 [Lasiodiplodia mahajangana]|uniref:Uncharacterized protein n=1 Tax=Lasiodiplodia mahajangana TaxID=1108764 RepID=A0ACC2JXP1_9PEZI|nr:hypothetical protein O1611_g1413 [Lasiodiplodia mahajangana]